LLQLHDPIRATRAGGEPGADEALDRILPVFEALRRAGKVGFVGMTAIGDTPAVHRVLDAAAVDSAQVPFNLLNPTAGVAVPPGFPGQDFERLLAHARTGRFGVGAIRVLGAGGRASSVCALPPGGADGGGGRPGGGPGGDLRGSPPAPPSRSRPSSRSPPA